MNQKKRQHPYYSPWRRAIYLILLVSVVLIAGTIGFHLLEGSSYLDAFYLTSMIATAQGPSQVPATSAGKMFASLMAFVSIGTVVTAAGFLFGPFFGQLWRIGHEHYEEKLK